MTKENFEQNANITVTALNDYLNTCNRDEVKVIDQPPMHELIAALDLDNLILKGGLDGTKLKSFVTSFLNATTRLHHPNFLAHQISIPHTVGAMGSFLDGALNNETSIYEMGPAATAIEYFMINWMLDKIGWRPSPVPGSPNTKSLDNYAGGVLTHGGSLANLTAMITARGARYPNIWRDGQPSNLAILVPEQSHYSLKRTAGIMGLGEKNCISLPADSDGRVLTENVPEVIDELEKSGKSVMAIVGNACGTAAGLYDPLDKLGDICNQRGIWFHVDAAHGAGAIVCKRYRHLVRGIDKADSIIWDAHKMFRTPALCAALLVKNHSHLDNSFSQEASYLFHEKDQNGVDLAMRTIECTKSALGLKMFMSLAAMGEEKLSNYIAQCTELARSAAQFINEQSDFECPVIPETNILCFRMGDSDARQLELRKKLLENGDYYISTTKYKNSRWLRCVFINPITTLENFISLIAEIRLINETL